MGLHEKTKNSYVISSLGRCGSQLMTETLHNHIWGFKKHEKSFLKRTRPFIREYPQAYETGVVHKTHLYPVEYPSNCKVIFTFGDPLDIVLSVIRKSQIGQWGPAHFKNLGADWSQFNKILSHDVLKLEKMFDAYYQKQSCDIACVRYESLWDVEEQLSEFLGFEFKMPQKKERIATSEKESLSPQTKQEFLEGYHSLIQKISNADDIKVWRA
jgi:hypothetical protein